MAAKEQLTTVGVRINRLVPSQDPNNPTADDVVEVDPAQRRRINAFVNLQTGDKQPFDFDYVAPAELNNQEIYNDMVAPLVRDVWDGRDACFICHGPASSGKGYTLFGDMQGQPGVIFLALQDIANRIAGDQKRSALWTMSMLQVREETVVDLLYPRPSDELKVEDHSRRGAYVPGLSELLLHDWEEGVEFLQQGLKVMMLYLQRGGFQGKPHMIIDVKVETQEKGNLIAPVRYAKLRFVFTLGSGGMWSEVDKGLKNLTVVLQRLNSGKERAALPFGDAVFTKLCEEALGGNCSTVFMGHIRTDAQSLDDSLRTLELTTLGKLKTYPRRNENAVNNEIQSLRDEIRSVRSKLELDRPGNFFNEINGSLLERLQKLTKDLDAMKASTWQKRIDQSNLWLEQRKEALRVEGMMTVLEQALPPDADEQRKLGRAREKVVKHLRKTMNASTELNIAAQQIQQLQIEPLPDPAQQEEQLNAWNAKYNEEAEKYSKAQESLRDKKLVMRDAVFAVVKAEEAQRKTFLMAYESMELFAELDEQDWENEDDYKNQFFQAKGESLRGQWEQDKQELAAKYPDPHAMVSVDQARLAEEKLLEEVHQHEREKMELEYINDQMRGRMFEKDFRYQAQLKRMQEQMLVVFREYRRHFEEQKNKMEQHYRKLLQESITDTLKLQSENVKLKEAAKTEQKRP